MKKLMFAAAVAALSTATFADGIVSSSVVGYHNKALKGNAAFNLTVGIFKVVGKEMFAMTDGGTID